MFFSKDKKKKFEEAIEENVEPMKNVAVEKTPAAQEIKNTNNTDQISYFYKKVAEVGLDNPNNWLGDPRSRIHKLFDPLLEGSPYYLIDNVTDSSAKIIELRVEGNPKRIMGIDGKKDMIFGAFFNHQFYLKLLEHIELPENQKKSKSQDHMKLTKEQVWNIFCIIGNRESLRV